MAFLVSFVTHTSTLAQPCVEHARNAITSITATNLSASGRVAVAASAALGRRRRGWSALASPGPAPDQLAPSLASLSASKRQYSDKRTVAGLKDVGQLAALAITADIGLVVALGSTDCVLRTGAAVFARYSNGAGTGAGELGAQELVLSSPGMITSLAVFMSHCSTSHTGGGLRARAACMRPVQSGV
jgi:hypothetical protein